MNKIIENIKSGNYEVVDNQGVSVTTHFIECLEEEFADLEAKLAESEEKKESYRLQNDEHHLQLLQFYSRLGVEAFGADIHEKALESLMIMKEEIEEKNGVRRALSACNRQNDEFADMIKKLVSEKEELKQQLAEKDEEIENLNNRILISQLQAPKEQILNILGSQCIQYNPDQDKISFAVEQLTQAKDYIKKSLENMWNTNAEMTCRDRSIIDGIYNKIDSQITDLKGNEDE